MPEVAKAAGVIETVADDEAVVDGKTHIIDLHIDPAPRRLAQQASCGKGAGIARAQDFMQIPQRRPTVDDVFDDDDMFAVNRDVQIAQETNFARGRGTLRIAREGDEIEREVSGNLPDQVRQKDEGPFEDRHEVESVREVAVELQGQLRDALLNLVLRE